MNLTRLAVLLLFTAIGAEQQLTVQDVDQILVRADKIFEECKSAYEEASSKSSVQAFNEAGFKLEEARIKYLVLQEIGAPDKQKIASDRLRAVNQLGKLIHDGKVAISGVAVEAPKESPAEAPAAKPAGAPEPKEAAPKPPPPPVKPVAEALRRFQVPDAAKQREAEKLIKDIFKDLYAKKTVADRQTLARLLLEQMRKTSDDAAAAWVLCREAQDAAAQTADVKLAVQAAEEAGRVFDIDVLLQKNGAIAAALKAARTSEEFSAATEALLRLADEHIAIDQYDAADKAAAAALLNAKRSGDPPLINRATVRSKEIAEAKSRFQSMKRILETLARNPDDAGANAEMGQFLAFVKGNWDLGLRFLAKGSDTTLKGISSRELAFPPGAAELAAIADEWYDLSEKEKSPLRKGQLSAHAMFLYEIARGSATGLTRAKIENRLADIEDARMGGINLIKLIDPKLDSIAGNWAVEGRSLMAPAEHGYWTRLQIPYTAPPEYDLTYVVKSPGTHFFLFIGLPLGGDRQGVVVIGGDDGLGAGLEMVESRQFNSNNPTHVTLPQRIPAATILCSVRKTGLTVMLNGKKIIDYKDYSKVTTFLTWQVPNKNAFFVGMSAGGYAIRHIVLNPVTGQGKPLR